LIIETQTRFETYTDKNIIIWDGFYMYKDLELQLQAWRIWNYSCKLCLWTL